MKKIILLFVIALLSSKISTAQSFSRGDNLAEIGVGFGGGYGMPIIISYEHALFDLNSDFSVGGGAMLGMGSEKPSKYFRLSHTLIGAIANVHYCSFDRTDLFAGVTLGGEVAALKDIETKIKNTNSGFMYDVHIGGRYYFTDHFAAVMQLGFGTVHCKLGATLRF